jgi:hypothetical protein
MADHPRETDPKGVNPTGQGPAQPRLGAPAKRKDTNKTGTDATEPGARTGPDADTSD